MPPDTATTDRSDTADRILDCAQERIQRCGYNAVSYGDLADALDLTTTAIHYHFPSKADLGEALVTRYREENEAQRAAIYRDESTLRARLEQYVEGYAGVLEAGGVCLCGILSSDASTLPDGVRAEVRAFFADQVDWLTQIIAEEHDDGAGLEGYDSPRQVAHLLLATIEGAMLTLPARDPAAYRTTLHRLINIIAA